MYMILNIYQQRLVTQLGAAGVTNIIDGHSWLNETNNKSTSRTLLHRTRLSHSLLSSEPVVEVVEVVGHCHLRPLASQNLEVVLRDLQDGSAPPAKLVSDELFCAYACDWA